MSRSSRPFNRGIVLFPAKTSHSGEWELGEPVATSSRTTMMEAPTREQEKRRVARRVGPWELIESLGAGSNSRVWRAKSSDYPEAALKILNVWRADAERYQRFENELAVLCHLVPRRGILPLLAYYQPKPPARGNFPWLAMPVATPIRERLGERPELAEAVRAVAMIANTLATLATESIAHRDLKPDNLYWLDDQYVIGDFGLVKFPEQQALTRDGRSLGPWLFLAPEMLTQAASADAFATDVFSLAKTLWALATGSLYPPPWNISADNVQARLSSYFAPGVAERLDLLLERATDLDPRRRPNMAEFRDELEAWLAPPPERVSALDLSELSAQLTVVNAPAQQEAELRRRWKEQARAARERLADGVAGLGEMIRREKLGDGQVRQVAGAFAYLGTGPPALGDPIQLWSETAGSIWTTVTDVTRGFRHNLISGGGFELFEGGRIRLVVGHVITVSIIQTGTMDRSLRQHIIWSDERMVPVGSAQEEHAIGHLCAELQRQFRPACQELLRLHRNE